MLTNYQNQKEQSEGEEEEGEVQNDEENDPY
jgi:hypothetical protein